MERLILDTSVLVATERGASGLRAVDDDDDVTIAAITCAELLVGVHLASGRHRDARAAFVDRLLEALPVEDYGVDVAREHAKLLVTARSQGRPRGAHDLIIAATALARDRTLVTHDARGFAELDQVRLRVIEDR